MTQQPQQTVERLQTATHRPTEAQVDPRFTERWSPRSFRSDTVPRSVVESMVEAARWAPSSINLQPWHFYIATSQSATRAAWNDAIGGGNRPWSDKAPILTWVVARRIMGPNPYAPVDAPNRHALYDTGAAALSFILEGERHGVKSHQMGGIDAAKAHALLGLDANHEVIAAIASGYPGNPVDLPEPYRAREVPSGRKTASQIATFA